MKIQHAYARHLRRWSRPNVLELLQRVHLLEGMLAVLLNRITDDDAADANEDMLTSTRTARGTQTPRTSTIDATIARKNRKKHGRKTL